MGGADQGSPQNLGEAPDFVGDKDRVLDARVDDDQYDLTLRPRMLSEYVGQLQVRENLGILLGPPRRGVKPVGHVLLGGRPGLARTTPAPIIPTSFEVET